MQSTHAPVHPIDLAAERAALGGRLEKALLSVLESGRYVLGPEVEAFEREFADLHGARFGISVATGTDALILGLRALGVGPGHSVLTSPFTFFATAAAIAWVGARPILADVDPETGLLDPRQAERAIERDTTCLIPVHLYGQLADMAAFQAIARARGLRLLEDGAQAHAARRDGLACGAWGDLGAFSFYVTKNLGAAGEGGLLLTQDSELCERLRRLRDHGSPEKYVHAEIGTNSRLHAMQAALLRVKLPHLESWNARRREHAARYDEAFEDHPRVRPLRTLPGALHAYHQYAVRILPGGKGPNERDRVLSGLKERQIFAAVHYPLPVHLQEAARSFGYSRGDFPCAENLAQEVLCLPIHPFLEPGDVDRVVEALWELCRG